MADRRREPGPGGRSPRVPLRAASAWEILYGLLRLGEGKRRRALEEASKLFRAIPCEAVPPAAAEHYARIKRQAEAKGTPLDENDLWIAATALESGAVLAASDADFGSVEGLSLEDRTA